MALTSDFWAAHASWKLAWEHLQEMQEIAIDEPRYASNYAFAKYAEASARGDLDEIINDLMSFGRFTTDMEAVMMPANLASIYPDASAIEGFWNASSEEDRIVLLLRLGVQHSVAVQFIETPFNILPLGIKEKMEAIHK